MLNRSDTSCSQGGRGADQTLLLHQFLIVQLNTLVRKKKTSHLGSPTYVLMLWWHLTATVLEEQKMMGLLGWWKEALAACKQCYTASGEKRWNCTYLSCTVGHSNCSTNPLQGNYQNAVHLKLAGEYCPQLKQAKFAQVGPVRSQAQIFGLGILFQFLVLLASG